MNLTLHHVQNVDLMHGQGNGSGYWDEVPSGPAREVVEVADLRAAQLVFRTWVERNGLGAGNLASDCGEVTIGNKVIACISYNGRIWEPGESPRKEIRLEA